MPLVSVNTMDAVEVIGQVTVVRDLGVLVNGTGSIVSWAQSETAIELFVNITFLAPLPLPIELVLIDKLLCIQEFAHRLRSQILNLLVSMQTCS